MSPLFQFLTRHYRKILVVLLFVVLYLISRTNYLFFHSSVELFSVIIAFTAFVLTWNSRRYLENGYLLFIGAAALIMGGIDLVHTLAYKGMGVFLEADANLPTQLWVAARYFQSLCFLFAPSLIARRERVPWALAGISALAVLMLLAIFEWNAFPVAYVDGVGLTRFKILSEYLIVLIFAAGIGLLWLNRGRFDAGVARNLMLSMVWGIATELSATLYVDVYGFFNIALHFFKILAFYHLYKAIIESGFVRPYNTIFRTLKASEDELLKSHNELEKLVRQRTQDLESQRAMLEAVLEQAADGILVVDPRGKVTFANHAARQLTAKPDLEAPEYRLSDFGVPYLDGKPVSQDERPAFMALRGEKVVGHELNMRQENGREFALMISATPLLGADGEITAAVVAFTDITEKRHAQELLRRAYANLEARVMERTAELQAVNQQLSRELQMRVNAERALRASESRLRRLVESNIIGVMFASITGEITEANDAFLGMVGYDREDLAAGRISWVEMTPPEFADADRRGLREAAESGAATPYEKEYVRKDGSRVPIMLGYATLEDHADRFICFVVDLSEQKQAEEAVRHYNEELERSNRELQDFAYVASHDLQEPLRKIIAFGDRLQDSAASRLEERERDYLGRMQRSAARMRAMINDLLALSRVTTRAQPFAQVDLNVVVSEVVSDLETRVERSGAKVEIESLPVVEADPLQMRQLLQNLIANALKFNRPGTTPEVRVFALPPPDSAEKNGHFNLLVEDNGIGFDMQYLDRVFQPFQRLHGMGEYEGSGMGLAICQKIVQRHGGTITAYSQPDHGSTFVVTLPYQQEER